jgi:hypothetical protein
MGYFAPSVVGLIYQAPIAVEVNPLGMVGNHAPEFRRPERRKKIETQV